MSGTPLVLNLFHEESSFFAGEVEEPEDAIDLKRLGPPDQV
jgi:hypothetical protein